MLVLALAVTLWADSRLNRIDASPEPAVSGTAGTNWLLVGSDSRQGLSEEDLDRLGTGGDLGVGRTDTIMLLHIPFRGESQLVSLPRDSFVSIPGYGQDKINAAFTYGGPKLLAATVEQNTGLSIDHYAEIGMGGLANVVDAVGGVELCLDQPIIDPLANLDVQAGCQTMDGPTALGYVRTRATPQADLDRVQRQREFFGALIESATSPGTLLNPFRLVPLVSETAGTFTVGEGDHVWHLARLALSMRGGVETTTVPVAGFADYAVGNVVLWTRPVHRPCGTRCAEPPRGPAQGKGRAPQEGARPREEPDQRMVTWRDLMFCNWRRSSELSWSVLPSSCSRAALTRSRSAR